MRGIGRADVSPSPTSSRAPPGTVRSCVSRSPTRTRRRCPTSNSVEPALIREAGDAERAIEREIEPAAGRAYDVDAWVSAAADADDAALDRLVGFNGPERPSLRPPVRGAARECARRAPSTATRTPRGSAARTGAVRRVARVAHPAPATIRWLRLPSRRRPPRCPPRVRLLADGVAGPPLTVGPDGRRPDAARCHGAHVPARGHGRPAGSRGDRGSWSGSGVPRVEIPRQGAIHGRCGDLRCARRERWRFRCEPSGRIEDLDAAHPAARGVLRPGCRSRLDARW